MLSHHQERDRIDRQGGRMRKNDVEDVSYHKLLLQHQNAGLQKQCSWLNNHLSLGIKSFKNTKELVYDVRSHFKRKKNACFSFMLKSLLSFQDILHELLHFSLFYIKSKKLHSGSCNVHFSPSAFLTFGNVQPALSIWHQPQC